MSDPIEVPKSIFHSIIKSFSVFTNIIIAWLRTDEEIEVIGQKYQCSTDVESSIRDQYNCGFGSAASTECLTELSESFSSLNHPPLHYDSIKTCLADLRKFNLISNEFQYPNDIEWQSVSSENINIIFKNANLIELNTAFLWSAFTKRWDLLKGFLDLGAQLNYYEPNYGLSALHLAAFSGCKESTKFLLSQEGSNLNIMHKCYTPLHCTAFGDSSETAKLLLEAGANIHTLTNDIHCSIESILHCAVRANAVGCVKTFCDMGANINQLDSCGRTPIHLAAELGCTECLRILVFVNGANVNLETKDKKYTALHFAAEGQHADCIDVLLENDACPNINNNRNQTPLHLAAKVHSSDCVKLLLKKGKANPNAQDVDKRTPLHVAVSKSNRLHCSDTIRTLLRNGADVNARDFNGFTPLHVAAQDELPDCVEVLLRHGADFSLKSKSGTSAFAAISKKTPAALNVINERFNECINLTKSSETENQIEMQFNFKAGLSHPKEYQLLNTFIEAKHKEFLLHPFCTAFLYIAWGRIRKCYYGMIYHAILFSLDLGLYVLTSLAFDCDKSRNNSASSNTTTHCSNKSFLNKLLKENPITIEIQWYTLLAMVLSLIYRKVYGFRGYPTVKRYLLNWSNILEWHCILYVFLISFIYTGTIETWQVQLGGLAVMCSSTNVMYLVGQLPVFGPYVEMFQKVQTEFFKLLFVYSWFLLGYTFGFCILFPNSPAFANPLIGFISTIVMMTGELNYELLLDYNDENNPSTWGKLVAQIAYTLFVLYLTIILMNLLVGIAVHDIHGLQKTADLSKLVRQAKVSSYIELSHSNRSKRSQFIMKLFGVIPKPYIDVLTVTPLDAFEDRLPKELLEAAYEIAKQKKDEKAQRDNQPKSKGVLWKKLNVRCLKHNNCNTTYIANLNGLMLKLDDHFNQIKSLHEEVNGLKISSHCNTSAIRQQKME